MAWRKRRKAPHVEISSSQSAMRVPRKKIRELVAFVAAAEGVRLIEADIAVVDGDEIARLNRRWLDHAGATDVLSFDMSDPAEEGLSAEIIVCGDVAAAEARARGLGVQRELMLYVTHGLLHLMGYDDTDHKSAKVMHARQEQLLDDFRHG
ncbi:MAG: rRNA maturation RNase YbeY [Phycisphaerae bacterium]